jgi:hypothetical protein
MSAMKLIDEVHALSLFPFEYRPYFDAPSLTIIQVIMH